MASHYDFYETMNDVLMHNHAPHFPQQEEGDSWQGALCPRHRQEAQARFGPGHGIRCENPACPATCAICNLEFQPRTQVA